VLKRLRLLIFRTRWLPTAATVTAAVLAACAVAFAVQHLADQHLAAEARRSANAWARHVGSTVQDIDLVFMGEVPGPTTQSSLLAMRGMDGLVRFRLFDPQGMPVLVSDSVGTPARPEDADRASREHAVDVARSGKPLVQVMRGEDAASPAVYSRAWVPVQHGSATLGVIELVLDQSDSALTAAASFRRAAVVAGLMMALCMVAAAVLMRHRARLERRARDRAAFLAEHDGLTGALNHAHFNDALARACSRPGAGPAVICIDLDGFAEVNERHGHRVGDELLRRTAERLRGLLRGADCLARLAGDRFAILQTAAEDGAAVTALVQRIVRRIAQPHDLPGLTDPAQPVRLSASVGAALHGTDGDDADTLLHNAELALLRAKSNGRGGWSFYDASLDRRLQDRRQLATDLRQALAEGGLRLHYQPLFAARSGELTGYEALARWPHPTRGFVPPADLIPMAEDSGQIEALGRWVLHTACAEAARWPEPLSVAVNLSAAQFRRGEAIVGEVRQALQASGLAPRRLELEITESLLMQHTDEVLRTLHALHALGVRIAMDDFGTGYSSLAYLWRFPFDKLKIDRAFTQGLGSDPRVDVIVGSIITLAHSLSIRVNAEGVETAAQQKALCHHGCDELQGYLLGRPVPSERLVHIEDEIAAVLVSV
jgi:diguanylate cyclase (GGDEF)-like protein